MACTAADDSTQGAGSGPWGANLFLASDMGEVDNLQVHRRRGPRVVQGWSKAGPRRIRNWTVRGASQGLGPGIGP